MTSLSLGRIGGKVKVGARKVKKNYIQRNYEVHAFTNGFPYRNLCTSEISDSKMFKELTKKRYDVLDKGRIIYCTAVNPDKKNKIEKNPHDEREGTIHIVAVDEDCEIVCGLSIATDIGDTYRGGRVGVPCREFIFAWKLSPR